MLDQDPDGFQFRNGMRPWLVVHVSYDVGICAFQS
jgi:hypothetical protein